MIETARALADGAEVSADVCVVGAGAAGITLALALRGSGRSVLLLEAGAEHRSARAQALYRGEEDGFNTFELDTMRLRLLGGSTTHWAGFCLPLAPEDFAARPHVEHGGWPIGYADVLPYYRRAQGLLELPGFGYDARASEREGHPPIASPSGGIVSAVYQFSGPTRFGLTYREPLERAADVSVLLDANVTRLVLAGDRLERLECACLDGPRFTARAETYVLATGGVENARLLLSSDVANGSGMVGRFFMEHPHYYDDATWARPAALADSFYRLRRVSIPTPPDGALQPVRVQGFLGLSAELRAAEGLLDFAASVRLSPSLASAGLTAEEVSALVRARHGEASAEAMTLRVEQSPHPDHRVTLIDDTDELGMRRVRLTWGVTDEDRRSLARGLRLLAAELGAARAGRLYVPVDERGRFVGTPEPGGHHIGTTRMGASASDGVVDADQRAFDVGNLYVTGSSVFRTGGRANPTLTVVALALRLADHLRGVPYEWEAP